MFPTFPTPLARLPSTDLCLAGCSPPSFTFRVLALHAGAVDETQPNNTMVSVSVSVNRLRFKGHWYGTVRLRLSVCAHGLATALGVEPRTHARTRTRVSVQIRAQGV